MQKVYPIHIQTLTLALHDGKVGAWSVDSMLVHRLFIFVFFTRRKQPSVAPQFADSYKQGAQEGSYRVGAESTSPSAALRLCTPLDYSLCS